MDIKEVIFTLCAAQGVSGSEESAVAVCARLLESYADLRTDANGNLYAVTGDSDAKKTILLDAHLDRIGLIVTGVNDRGFVKVDKCGGMDIRVLQNAVLTTEDGLKGIVCGLPPHLSDGSEDKATPIDKVWLDFGMSGEEAKKRIHIGDKLTFCTQPAMLAGGKITAPALDNRSGAAALIKTAALLSEKDVPYRVVMLFSAQEETYGTGALTGAYQIDADEAIVVDVSFSNQPDVSGQYGGVELNRGPMLGFSPILSKPMSEKLQELAKRENIPLQYEAMSGRTGTNADHISVSKRGVKTALLSVPERYMHTQAEVVHPADVEHTAALIAAYIFSGGAFND